MKETSGKKKYAESKALELKYKTIVLNGAVLR